MTSLGPAGPASAGNLWTHRTAEGVEYGGETPTGRGAGSFSALGRALVTTWQLRKTLWLIVVYDFKSRYRAQSLGMFWSLANPLVMMAVLTLAFTQILIIPIPNFPIFYLIAGIQWHFFVGAVSSATGSLPARADLVKRTTLPRHFAPLAAVLSNAINLAMEALVLFAFYFVFPDAFRFGLSLLVLPVIPLLLILMTLGLVLITSALYVKFRDTHYFVTSFITLGFWVTPILFSTEMAPPWIRNFLRLNPLSGLMEGARDILMHDKFPEMYQLAPSMVATGVLLLVGALVFQKNNLTLADYV